MKKTAFVLYFIFCFFDFNAQEKTKLYNHSFGFDIAIPKTISNEIFNSNFDEVAELGFNYDLMLFKNFSLGISYRYSYFELNKKSFTTDVNGQLDSHFTGLTTAISKLINDKIFFKYGISFGKNQVLKKATGFENLNSPNYNNFISPFFSLFMYDESVGAVGLFINLSYADYVYDFDLTNPNATYVPNNTILDKLSWFAVGFKYDYLIK